MDPRHGRVRQTLVGTFGVAIGVGFTIMMAGLMQGSQIDFLRQLVDAMPHITVQDERRTAPAPTGGRTMARSASSVANVSVRAASNIPTPWSRRSGHGSGRGGAIGQAHGDHRSGPRPYRCYAHRHRSPHEVRVSKLVTQMREGPITDLQGFAEFDRHRPVAGGEARARTGNTVMLIGGEGSRGHRRPWSDFSARA